MDLKPYDVKNTLRNIELVFRYNDIDKLNKKGYDFLYLMSGFIAHFNIHGFKNAYRDLRDLLNNIESSLPIEKDVAIRDIKDPNHNSYGLPYCQSKLEIVEGLEKIIPTYKEKIEKKFREIEKENVENEIAVLQNRLATI